METQGVVLLLENDVVTMMGNKDMLKKGLCGSLCRNYSKDSGFGIHSHRGKGYCFEKGERYQFIYDV